MAKPSVPPSDLQNRPNQDGRDRNARKDRRPMPGAGSEARTVEPDVSTADTQARTGKSAESVRNTPPFADHDDLKH
jgi:hypothetical protein